MSAPVKAPPLPLRASEARAKDRGENPPPVLRSLME